MFSSELERGLLHYLCQKWNAPTFPAETVTASANYDNLGFFPLSDSYINVFFFLLCSVASAFNIMLNKCVDSGCPYFIFDFQWHAFNILSVNGIFTVVFLITI